MMTISVAPPVDILIVTALPEELDALKGFVDLNSPIRLETSSLIYYINSNVIDENGECYSIAVLCLNAMGNPNAAVDVTNAIRDFNPDYVVMFGIAGGVETEVALADVIVPDKIFYYAPGKVYPAHVEIRQEPIGIDFPLLASLRAYRGLNAENRSYQVKVGPFAVSEQVIASTEYVKKLRDVHPKVIGFEMESYGAGLATTKALKETTFFAIRGVSDYGNDQKSDTHRGQALQNAAQFLIGFIKSGLFPRKSKLTKPARKYIALHHLSLFQRPPVKQAVQSYLSRLQSYDVTEIPINQVGLAKNDCMANPAEALMQQEDILAHLDEYLEGDGIDQLGYFGLAHIPLMFRFGYRIWRREIEVFGNDYTTSTWIDLPEQGTCPAFTTEGIPQQVSPTLGDVILLVSISREIKSSEPNDIVPSPLASIHLKLEQPQFGVVSNKVAVAGLTAAFRDILEMISTFIPQTRNIHLFYAGPPTLALRFAQQISHNMHPRVIVYNYSRHEQPNYRWGINLHSGEIIERGLADV